ncbi:MAG TPA: hypothetical protein PLQ54_01830 [Armatimonadota bacterium]|nr:hypothetical protein [Armatimonadota bacterium]
MILTCLVAASAEDPPAAQPAPEQWIAPLPDDVDRAVGEDWVEEWMGKWVVWPSEDEVRARGPLRDRRAEFPAEGADGKPIVRGDPGAVSPDEARADAAAWVRRILKPELVPDDLDDGFVLLQEEDPSRSSVLCRFEIHGTGIQVTQLRWALCVVMRPDPALIEGLEPRAIGPAAFRAVFTKGDAMAGARFSDVPGLPYFAQELDLSVSSALWWGGFFWYTDGRSTAVYIRRADRGHSPARAGDPWF